MHEALKQNRKYPVHTAISSYIGESEFYIFDRNDGVSANACSALEPDERLVADHVSYIAGQRKVTVPVETLDSCLEKYAELFPRIDYVNIDVEGTELDVLKGFSIDKWDVQLFVVENNYEDPECRDYLKAFGYKLDWRKYKNDYFVK